MAKFFCELKEDPYSDNFFESSIELPFGTLQSKLVCQLVGEDDPKYQDVTIEKISKTFKCELEPIPISMADQAAKDKLEEEENKKREQDARAAQERLEAEKARLRQEQML